MSIVHVSNVIVNPILEAQLYRCHQCGAVYQPAVFRQDGQTTWAACTACDNTGRRAGDPGFNPHRYPRWNVIFFIHEEHPS